ncbi:MAG: arginine--tRNA ligase, partial [Stellaceae bacterium]
MNPFRHFHGIIAGALDELAARGELAQGLDTARIAVEPPRDPAHGDLSTNAAMVLAKSAGMAPKVLAERLRAQLAAAPAVIEAAIAGPGFLNLRLADSFWHERLRELLRAGTAYGDSDIGRQRRVNV